MTNTASFPETSNQSSTMATSCPMVTRDARFRAAKKLKQSGRVHLGAIPMLETLANRAEEEFGTRNIETATVYYELGHAMFLKLSAGPQDVANVDENYMEEALEYMAKACSILYEYVGTSTSANHADYWNWAKDEIPRHLIGIANVQSFQMKHADAIESYLNAIPYREEACDRCKNQSVASLRHQRLLTESYILIAEELLVCKAGQDVVHSETGKVIVRGEEILSLAENYYEQAREKLQDIGKFFACNMRCSQSSAKVSEQEPSSFCNLTSFYD